MKKIFFAAILIWAGANTYSGEVGLPTEKLALPVVQGNHLVCIWDDASGDWMGDFVSYNHEGVYDFAVPEWGRWYWVGLWDDVAGEYVFGKWVGHFPTE